MYHQEMIPTRPLLSIISAKQDVPFSTGIEVIGMLVALELFAGGRTAVAESYRRHGVDNRRTHRRTIGGRGQGSVTDRNNRRRGVGHRVLHAAKPGSRRGSAADTLRAAHRRGRGGAVRHWVAVVPDLCCPWPTWTASAATTPPRHRRAASRHTADSCLRIPKNRRQIPRRRASPARQEETVLKRAIMYLLCLAAAAVARRMQFHIFKLPRNRKPARRALGRLRPRGRRHALSLASSANDDGEPIRMTTKGGSITDAMERIRNYSSQEDIFYPPSSTFCLARTRRA